MEKVRAKDRKEDPDYANFCCNYQEELRVKASARVLELRTERDYLKKKQAQLLLKHNKLAKLLQKKKQAKV